MNGIQKTSRLLHKICKVLKVALSIALVCCLVAVGIAAAALIFDIDPEKVGTGYEALDVGFVELTLAEGYVPNMRIVLVQLIVGALLGAVAVLLLRLCVNCVLRILEAMEKGQPFHCVVAENLKRMAGYVLGLGIAGNCMENAGRLILIKWLDLPELLLSDKIIRVTVNFDFNLTFVLVAAVLLLLSHVFRYGQTLQQLSDETL